MSIVITLTGAIALYFLPLAQYPRITPPAISVSITYPGSSPQITAETVAAPIEQQVNGVEGMLYMSSQMGTDGSYTLTVTFDVSVDLNTALVMVQNRVALAMPQLPTAVQNQGITIRKKTPDILMVISFYSPDSRYDDIYLSNFATIFIKDEILRVDGVSDVGYLGTARLQHSRLARSAKAGVAQHDRHRRQERHPQSEPGRARRTARPAALRPGSAFAAHDQHPGPTYQSRAVRRHHRQGRPEPIHGPQLRRAGAVLGRRRRAQSPIHHAGPEHRPDRNDDDPDDHYLARRQHDDHHDVQHDDQHHADLQRKQWRPGIHRRSERRRRRHDRRRGGERRRRYDHRRRDQQRPGLDGGHGNRHDHCADAQFHERPVHPHLGGQQRTEQRRDEQHNSGQGPGRQSAAIVRLKDVARVDLGAQNYNQACTFDGHQAVGMSVYQLPGTNALDVADRIRSRMKELKTRFPEGLEYEIGYDTTPFIRESVEDVVWTLLEAVGLVALVVMVFLQNWRAVIIPLVAVPVAIVGTFAVMAAVGFSLNNISLFGLVLAIGIVVDDAIVVVENVERWLEHGLSPREATRKAMDEVTGPIIAVALVLCAVFVPCAFIGGITGRFFIQFAVTISVSTLFSTFNSLTLSPALAAILLKPHGARRDPLTWVLDMTLGWFFWIFNKLFGAGTAAYVWTVKNMLRVNVVVLIGYAGLAFLAYWVFKQAPTGFVPQQDQGRLIGAIQMPDSWSLQRTKASLKKIERITLDDPGVGHVTTIAGLSFVQQCNSSNFASMLVILKPFASRQAPGMRDTNIMDRAAEAWREEVPDAKVLVFGASPIPGLSVAGGFKIIVEDRGGVGLRALEEQTNDLIDRMKELPELTNVSRKQTNGKTDTKKSPAPSSTSPKQPSDPPGKIKELPLLSSVSTQFRTQDAAIVLRHRPHQGLLDGGLAQRRESDAGDVSGFACTSTASTSSAGTGRSRSRRTASIAIGSRTSTCSRSATTRDEWCRWARWSTFAPIGGPVMIIRYNLFVGAPITGNIRPGVSSGEAIDAINKAVGRAAADHENGVDGADVRADPRGQHGAIHLPAVGGGGLPGPGGAVRELDAAAGGDPGGAVVPALLGGGSACALRGALLHQQGREHLRADRPGGAGRPGVQERHPDRRVRQPAAPRGLVALRCDPGIGRLRLRPILMTSFAFILGVVPLVIATGPGRRCGGRWGRRCSAACWA